MGRPIQIDHGTHTAAAPAGMLPETRLQPLFHPSDPNWKSILT
jgi:hypothetical protein